jgi:hypothetical protein
MSYVLCLTHGLHVFQLLGVHLHPRLLQGVHEGDQLIKPRTLYTKTKVHRFGLGLKGLCHEMNTFLEVLKIKSVLSV